MLIFKKSKIKLIALLLVVFVSICTLSSAIEISPDITNAADSSDVVTTALDDTNSAIVENNSNVKHSDLFLLENVANINNTVDGNVFVMAKEVNINSPIYGNAFILAESVNISENATIYNSAFILANNVTINGNILDLYCTSNNLKINTNSIIARDINTYCQSFILDGHIGRNANLSCGSISFNTTGVKTAKIDGNLSYSSEYELDISKDIVAGNIHYNKVEADDQESTKNIVKEYASDLLKVLIVSIIVILVMVFAAPKFVNKQYYTLTHKPWASLGYGALALIATPLVCFILFITIIGIIPSLALLFTYIFVVSISPAILAIPLGKLLCKKINKQSNGYIILMSIVCVIAIWILTNIPIIGGLLSLITSLLSLGILTYAIFNSKKIPSDTEVVDAQ